MIYEVRTYDLEPGSLPEVVKRFGECYPVREKYSKLAGFFCTEIGPLNQIIHVWPYESTDARTRIRKDAMDDGGWPPPIAPYLMRMESEIFTPFPFVEQWKPGQHGPIYEMRYYVTKAAKMPAIMEKWERKMPPRHALSPCVSAMYTDIGELNKFIHIWAYRDLNHRAETRQKAIDEGLWPPGNAASLVSQANKIMLPSAFSPMQ